MGSLTFTPASLIYISYKVKRHQLYVTSFQDLKTNFWSRETLLDPNIIWITFISFKDIFSTMKQFMKQIEVFLHSQVFHFSKSKVCKDLGKATSLLWLAKGTRAQLVLTCWQKDWMEKGNPGGWNTKWGVLIECDDIQIEFSKNVRHLLTNLGDKGTVISCSDHTHTISYIKSE